MSFSRSTQADLDVLADHEALSGYHSVYPKRGRWCVREPFRKRYLGSFAHPREGAVCIARWWRKHFGPDWAKFFRGRAAPPWVARQTETGIWELFIYVKGNRRRVPLPKEPIASRRDAILYLRAFCKRRYGRHAWRLVRRTAPALTPSPGGIATCI